MRTFQFTVFLVVSVLMVGCGISSTPTRTLTGIGGGTVAEAQRISLGLGDMAVQNAASLPSLTLPVGKDLTVGGTITATGGLIGTATNATNTFITDDPTMNTTVYPTWVTGDNANLPQMVSKSNLSFNPSTGTLTALTFSGNLNGNATTAGTATNATNTFITDDPTMNTTVYPTWVTGDNANLPRMVSKSNLYFNPSTGTLTATTFSGNLNGNATTATTAITATTANSATSATSATAMTLQGIPGSSGSPCTQGMMAADTDWLYICVANNTWRRVAISTF